MSITLLEALRVDKQSSLCLFSQLFNTLYRQEFHFDAFFNALKGCATKKGIGMPGIGMPCLAELEYETGQSEDVAGSVDRGALP